MGEEESPAFFFWVYDALKKERESEVISEIESFVLLNKGKNFIKELEKNSQLDISPNGVIDKSILFAKKYQKEIRAFSPNSSSLIEYLIESTKNEDPQYEFTAPDFADAVSLINGISNRLIEIHKNPEIFQDIFNELNRDMDKIELFIRVVIDLGLRVTAIDDDLEFISLMQTVGALSDPQEFNNYKEKKLKDVLKNFNKIL